MADTADTVHRFLEDDITGIAPAIADAFGYESEASRKAKRIEAERIKNAKDNLEFQKGTDARNQTAIDQLYSQLFGTPMPDKYAAQAAPQSGPAPAAAPSYAATPGAAAAPAANPESGGYFDPSEYLAGTAQGQAAAAAAPVTPYQAPSTAPQQPEGSGLTRAANPYLKPGEVPTGTVSAVNEFNKPGPWSLPGVYSQAETEQGRTVQDFIDAIGSIKDPALAGYAGDVRSEANVSDATKAAQTFAMDKLRANTDVKETAEEKLMREMARRKMEGQMKGDRDAMAQNLKARGVYGSGAELASQLGSQSETASRRALEELAAQANAQQRAMNALGQYSLAGQAMGKQDLEQGRMHDIVNQSNQQLKQQGEQFKAKQQIDMNRDKLSRDTAGLNAKSRATSDKVTHANDLTNVLTSLAGMRVGANTTGAGLVSKGYNDLDPKLATQQAAVLANDDSTKPMTRLF